MIFCVIYSDKLDIVQEILHDNYVFEDFCKYVISRVNLFLTAENARNVECFCSISSLLNSYTEHCNRACVIFGNC